jgi:hypothetical protein
MKKATLAKATNLIEGPSLKARHQDWTRQSINLLKDQPSILMIVLAWLPA